MHGASGLTREYVWIWSVGSMLRSLRPAKTPNEIFMEYQAAGVGSRKLVAVMREITAQRFPETGTCSLRPGSAAMNSLPAGIGAPIVFILRESIAVSFVRQSKHTGTT